MASKSGLWCATNTREKKVTLLYPRNAIVAFSLLCFGAACNYTDRSCSQILDETEITDALLITSRDLVSREEICETSFFRSIDRSKIRNAIFDSCGSTCEAEFTSFMTMLGTMEFLEGELCESRDPQAGDIAYDVFRDLIKDFEDRAVSLRVCLKTELG